MKRAKKYHPNHPHIDGRNVVIGSDYDALAAKAERYIQEGISLADQRDALAADNQRLLEALATARYRIEQGRVWNGMGWTLTGLHSHGQQKAIDAIEAALAGSKELEL